MVENGSCGVAGAERGGERAAVGTGLRLVRYMPDAAGTAGDGGGEQPAGRKDRGGRPPGEDGRIVRLPGRQDDGGTGTAGTDDFGIDGLQGLWTRLVEDDLVRVVFHDGGVTDFGAFARLLAPERAWLYRVDAHAVPQGFFWCNGFSGRAAQVHFCFFRNGMSAARAAGDMALTFLLAPQCADAPLDTLLGVTPAPYRHALRLAADLGFSRLGVVPAGTRLAPGTPGGGEAGRVVDVVLTVLTRDAFRTMTTS